MSQRKPPSMPLSTLLIDRREQKEPLVSVPWEWDTLAEGDVSTRALREIARIERKNPEDFAHSVGPDHDRVFREAERLKKYAFRMVVVEADLDYYMSGRARSRVHINSILGSVCSLYARYGCPVLFAHDPETSWRMIIAILARLEDEQRKAVEGSAAA